MFGRPRCREWTPLATQQLRLRSLIQIVGYNIRPPEGCISPCSYYITLHHTTMSAPFYMSERISSPHPKWKEIDSEITQGMSSTNVVIRVWCRLFQSKESDLEERPPDTVIQTWGIYFSGMRYIGANLASNFTSDCFKSNTLVFQMHGGYFCSYKSLKLDIIPAENEIEQGSLSSDSSGKTNLSKIVLESKFIKNHKHFKESRSVSPSKFAKKSEKEYSKSQSPVERGFKQNVPKLKPSASFVIQNSKDRNKETNSDKVDPSHIYEHSPDSLDVKEFYEGQRSKDVSVEDLSASKIDLSETAENYDLRSEAGVPKYRYQSLSFLKSEIRPSYNATKLQKLHILQYSIKKKQDAVQEIKERIYKNSAVSDSLLNEDDRSKSRCRSQRNLFSADDEGLDVDKSLQDLRNGKVKEAKPAYNGPRLTLKLNDLLSFKAKPSPLQRAEHVRLTKQMEILRFKRIILSDERDSKLANIRRLKEKHAKLLEANQDLGLELFESYHILSRDKEALPERVARVRCLREAMGRAKVALANRRDILLADLAELMNIKQKDETTWTICDVPLPICSDEGPRNTSAVSDAVAAGLAAQAAVLAASVLSQPLRYQITLLGSATKILDVTPDLPDPNIPLFARGGDVSLFRYGMFLLNKTIAQLAWSRGRRVADMRPTLANLARLTAPPVRPDSTKMFDTCRWLDDNQCPRTQSLRSLVVSERGKYRQFNRFKDSVDGQPPHAKHIRTHRHTRSVGSYTDDKEMQALDASTTSVMGSESNIYDMKLANTTSSELADYKKTHNSESELSRLADDSANQSVAFITADENNTQLVRLSTNNGDAATKDLNEMQRILCTEIEDFCTTNSTHDYKDIHEGFDVAKHMDAVKDMDIANHMRNSTEIEKGVELSCDTCVNNMDEVCDIACATNITDVILIPSDDVLDTGQVCADVKEA